MLPPTVAITLGHRASTVSGAARQAGNPVRNPSDQPLFYPGPPAPPGFGFRVGLSPGWWEPVVVAAGACMGAGLGYRVGAQLTNSRRSADPTGAEAEGWD